MATLRLDDGFKAQIVSHFREPLNRVMHNAKFPIEEKDVWDVGLSLLPPEVKDAYLYVSEYNDDMTRTCRWIPSLYILDGDYKYSLTVQDSGASLPYDNMHMPRTHPLHDEVLKFAIAQTEAQKQLTKADDTLTHIIWNCTSIGQVKRIMEKDADLLKFVPEHMQRTFAEAERRSRIPKAYTRTPADLQHLGQVLATGSLSPKNVVGTRVQVEASIERTTLAV
jgi:hypothetical protein